MQITAELRLRHGKLKKLAIEMGSIKALAEAVNIGYQTMAQWVNLCSCPTPGVYTRHYTKEVEKTLEQLSGCSAEELFPKELKQATDYFRKNKVQTITKEIEPQQLLTLALETEQRLITNDPIEKAIASEAIEKIRSLLKTSNLSRREKEILILRYGLTDGTTYTHREIGHIFKITANRARQVGDKALRKLQASQNSDQLIDFLPTTPPDFAKIDKEFQESLNRSLSEKFAEKSL